MSYAVSSATPEFATGFPTMIAAGADLTVIVSRTKPAGGDFFRGVQFSYRIEPEDEGRWGRVDPQPWNPLDNAPELRLSDQDESAARTQARAYVLPTSKEWSGVLVVTVKAGAEERPSAGSVLLISDSELLEMSQAIGTSVLNLRREWTAGNPVDGSDEFDVSHVMRRAGAEAETEAVFAGPLIKVNVRSHQESLAVMGRFERRAPMRLVGAPDLLSHQLVNVIRSVRRTRQYPGPVRLAYQTLWRGRSNAIQLLAEISSPHEPAMTPAEIALLLAELHQDQPVGWSFRGSYEERRLRIFAAIGRFRSSVTENTNQPSLDLFSSSEPEG